MKEFEISTSQGEIQRSRSLFQSLSELKTLASAQMNLNQPAPSPAIAEKKPEVIPPQQQQVEKQPETIVQEKTPPAQPVVREQPKKEAPVAVAKTETPAPAPLQPQPTAEELNNQRAKAHVKDGARRYFQGDFDAAIAAFSAALKLAPQDASAQFLLGCAYANKYLLSGASDQSAFQKASVAFQKIQRSAPNLPLTRSPLISPAVRDLYLKAGGA
jgi:outer membrane biosynthesis protein TonB